MTKNQMRRAGPSHLIFGILKDKRLGEGGTQALVDYMIYDFEMICKSSGQRSPCIFVKSAPQAGVEPTTSAFRFVLVSQLPGLSLHRSFRFRWQPSSLYTFLTRPSSFVLMKPVLIRVKLGSGFP